MLKLQEYHTSGKDYVKVLGKGLTVESLIREE